MARLLKNSSLHTSVPSKRFGMHGSHAPVSPLQSNRLATFLPPLDFISFKEASSSFSRAFCALSPAPRTQELWASVLSSPFPWRALTRISHASTKL